MSCAEKVVYNLNPMEYRGSLEVLNDVYLAECQERVGALQRSVESYGACIIAVGSDGKRERHPQSKTELVFVQGQDSKDSLSPEMIVKTFNSKSRTSFQVLFDTGNDNLPSVLKIGKDTLSFALHDSHLVFPDRVLNSTFILGNHNVFVEARRIVATELALTPGLSGKIRRDMRNQIKNYRKNALSGLSRNVKCFDEENQYYDERNNPGKFGFKHSFLRTTQRFLDIKTQESIQRGTININQIDTLPVNTADRIDYFGLDESLGEAYIWFLQRYHCIQEEYKQRRNLTKIPYDKEKFAENKDIILRICKA